MSLRLVLGDLGRRKYIQDIVWPGESHVPPQGVPEKFHISIGFLEEPPFINLARPDHVTGKCNVDRGIRCWVKQWYFTLQYQVLNKFLL